MFTFVGATGDDNLFFDVQFSTIEWRVVITDGFSEPETPLGMRVVITGDRVEGFISCLFDPLRRWKVHVPLAKIDAVCGKVCCTGDNQNDFDTKIKDLT